MNVYDFDKTITDQDSSFLFISYILKKYPRAIILNAIGIISETVYSLKSKDPSNMKEQLFKFVKYFPNINETVESFWDENWHHIQNWYLEAKRDDDLIISASPDFLVRPAAERLGVRLIATPMSPCSGSIQGINCKGDEKVRRLDLEYPDVHVENFYSDSLSDSPMARRAERAWLVDHGKLSHWPN